MFKNRSLSTKAYLFVGGLLCLMIVGSVYSYTQISKVEQASTELGEMSQVLVLVQELRFSVLQLVMPVNDFLIVGANSNERDSFASLLEKANLNLSILEDFSLKHPSFQEYSLAHNEKSDIFFINHVSNSIQQIKQGAYENFDLPDAQNNPLAGEKMELVDSTADHIGEQLGNLIQQIESDQRKKIDEMQYNLRLVNISKALLLYLSITVCVLFLFFMYFSLIRPINNLLGVVQKIKNGDLSHRTTVTSKDEIGRLETEFNEMASQLQKSHEFLEKEVQEKTVALNAKNDNLEKLVKDRTAELESLKNGLEIKVAEKTKDLQSNITELERLNKSMIGRELKMIDLKKENEKLREIISKQKSLS